MSSNSNTNFNLEKLQGRENYSTWAYAMENYLEIEDLWGCVTGSVTDATKCRKAKGRIVLNINPRLYDHFRELVSPMEIWEKLKTLFADNGLDRRIGLIRQLTHTKLSNCESMEDYVNTIMSAARKLSSTGFKISDEWEGCLLLSGLSDEYRPMIMSMESSNVAISADTVKIKLLQDIREPFSTNTSLDVAMLSNSNSKICNYCKHEGHWKNDCPKLKNKLQSEDYSNNAF